MYYLGIFGGNGPNPAAAILKKNRLIAFAEEERFTRIKNSPSQLPIKSILFCLDKAKIKSNDLSAIGIAWNCPRYIKNQPKFLKKMHKKFGSKNESYNMLYEDKLLNAFNPIIISESLRFNLAKSKQFIDKKKIIFFDHHLCHAASTFFASGFKRSLIFTIDGSGEENCTVEWIARNQKFQKLRVHNLPNTLGGYYGTFTEFLGFKSDSEEGKLMGLAPYGKFDQTIQDKLSKFLSFSEKNGAYNLNPKYRFYGKRTYNSKFTDKLVNLLGPNRISNEPLTQFHKDLAYNVQWRLEKVVSSMVKFRINKEDIQNVCLAGGVSMNCKMNGEISKIENLKRLYVQPASSDNGTALGAACLLAIKDNQKIFDIMPHTYWGSEYKDNDIEISIKESKLKYLKSNNISSTIAKELAKGKIIGWMQGRSEIGARALGARSILANPLIKNMRDKLNLEVKHREKWRPFCPSMTDYGFKKYFGHNKQADHMIIAYSILDKYHSLIPSAVHVDGSVRAQKVKKSTNPKFYDLLKKFGEITGHPILINTSFNIQGEPIVETPRDALRCFGGTGIDILVIGNFIIKKKNVK